MENFEKQIRYLKEHGYRFLKVRELYQIVSSGKKIPEKSVLITIDDGYKSTYKAFKLLRRLKVPFTVFLYMEAVGRYPDFLTKEQLREMEKSGLVEFENHLYSHPKLAFLRLNLPEEEYRKVLKKEAELSEKRFFELFKRKPDFLAFPYGDYDRISVEFFKKRGYKLLFTQDRGAYGGSGALVPRMAVVGSLSGFKRFVKELQIEPLPVKEHWPRIGLFKGSSTKIWFEIPKLSNYRNCSIYASKVGWIKGNLKGNKVESEREVKLKKAKTRIGVRCYNLKTNRKAEFFFLTLVKGARKAPEKSARRESHQ
jgi:peptidoglycan/xylan/chitin deacetylase (PgdA/CDA1 family)